MLLLVIVFQELLTHSHHVQELVGEYIDKLGRCSGGNGISVCSVNDEGMLMSFHQLPGHHQNIPLSLTRHELFDPLLRA